MRAALLLSGAAVVAAVDFFKILNISDYAEQDEIKQACAATRAAGPSKLAFLGYDLAPPHSKFCKTHENS